MRGEVFPLWSVPLRSVQWAALVRALRRRGGATAALAQSAERLTRNEKVKGSIPLGGSTASPQVNGGLRPRSRAPIRPRIGPLDRGRKPPLTCGDAVEPPKGIEPLTFSLRVRRSAD